MKRALLIGFILLYAACLLGHLASGQDGSQGPSMDISPPSPSVSRGDDSGGSLRAPDIDNFIRQVESWKNNYPDRFDYLKKLLYKEPFTTQKYSPPAVWVYYPPMNNTTVSRDENIKIGAVILNQNPIEIRRALFLDLEIQEPGEKEFRPAKTGTQIIQVNEYNEKSNATMRIFPDFRSFSYLKRVGDATLRIRVSDGQYNYYTSIQKDFPKDGCYGELKMKVYNIPPQINNTTMVVSPDFASWDDSIQYTASFNKKGKYAPSSVDQEKGMIDVTLHILNNNNTEISNITKLFQLGSQIEFSTKDKKFFEEKDSGKNFTYRYSCSDGIIGGENTTWTEIKEGPHLKLNPKIKVKDFFVDPEDNNYYWWQKYNFGFKAKSQNPDGEMLTATLYTDTLSHPKKFIASQTVFVPGDKFTDIIFENSQPFDVANCNQTFLYYFKYSLPDENGNTQSILKEGAEHINAKLVRYPIYAPEMVANLLLIIALALLGGFLVEWKFYRKGGT